VFEGLEAGSLLTCGSTSSKLGLREFDPQGACRYSAENLAIAGIFRLRQRDTPPLGGHVARPKCLC